MQYIDIPGRALLHLRRQCPDAPADPDRYTRFTVEIDRVSGSSIAEDGYWEVNIRTSWESPNCGTSYHSNRMPLSKLLSDVYIVPTEMSDVE